MPPPTDSQSLGQIVSSPDNLGVSPTNSGGCWGCWMRTILYFACPDLPILNVIFSPPSYPTPSTSLPSPLATPFEVVRLEPASKAATLAETSSPPPLANTCSIRARVSGLTTGVTVSTEQTLGVGVN